MTHQNPEISCTQTHDNQHTKTLSFHMQFNTTKHSLKLVKIRRKAWSEPLNGTCEEKWIAYNDSVALLHGNLQTLLYLVYNLEHCEMCMMDSATKSKIGAVKADYRCAIEEIWMKDCEKYHSDRNVPFETMRTVKVSFQDKVDVIKIDSD